MRRECPDAIRTLLVAEQAEWDHFAAADAIWRTSDRDSRATTAPWDITPPISISITSPPAVTNSGVHAGSVDGATRTSPGSNRAPTGDWITCAMPLTTPGEAGEPRTPSTV